MYVPLRYCTWHANVLYAVLPYRTTLLFTRYLLFLNHNYYHLNITTSSPEPSMDPDISDNESILSDVDEAQFEDFDPANVAIDDRPIAVNEDNVRLLGRHKRKRDGEGVDVDSGKRKRKEGRREKPKKSRKKKDDEDEDDFSGGQELEGKRVRRKKSIADGGSSRKEKTRARRSSPENEEALDPEEREFLFLTLLLFAECDTNIQLL